jgi:hypothetical protein
MLGLLFFFESYILVHLSRGPAGLPLFFVSAAATVGGEPDQTRSRPDRAKSFVSAQATQRVYIVQNNCLYSSNDVDPVEHVYSFFLECAMRHVFH